MRYRWHPEDESRIIVIWDHLCQEKFRIMMNLAKACYEKGRAKGKYERFSWMETPQWLICVKRWNDQANIEAAQQKRRNRGVVITENGERSKAPPRYYGGPISMDEIAMQKVS